MSLEMFQANPSGVFEVLRECRFLIFGAGGLGSNAAVMLVRAGAGALTLVDFDVIVRSNLNRQYYFADQIGMKKVQALKENLSRINPEIKVEAIEERVEPGNLQRFSSIAADIVLECFDDAECKASLVAHFIKNKPETPIVAVSGLAGVGAIGDFKISRGPGKLVVIGDPDSGSPEMAGTLAAAAAMQAHEAIRLAGADSDISISAIIDANA
ncbi:MAG: sulfur carrier protein ThiS adenylyltransferase ThiF [Kiritimatiellaeota bacterium]|nr:sulfur carrier protein ThiS adenylyltransferase ThiF [Kiritimatiellota bacterium]